MPAKTLHAENLVEGKFFEAAVLNSYRDTLPTSEKKVKFVKVKVLGLVRGAGHKGEGDALQQEPGRAVCFWVMRAHSTNFRNIF
jgi:hypothetical protein